jgi:hypothetical protein
MHLVEAYINLSTVVVHMVDLPKSNTTIIRAPIFKWYVVRCD